jgi:hypothetical protein
MKNIAILFITFLFGTIVLNAQIQTKPLENGIGLDNNSYYKDINNVLDEFVGTYEYNGPDFYFKLKLVKRTMKNVGDNTWWDILEGTYQYTKNGVTANYLSDALNTNDVARIEATWIKQTDDTGLPYFCPECLNEKWLTGYISDRVNSRVADLFIAKRIVNGEVGLQLGFYYEWPRKSQNAAHLPEGEFFVKKIN